MKGTRNYHGATLADCSVPSRTRNSTRSSLFAMMSTLPAKELKRRISDIEDQDTRVLAQAHMDALADDWDGPIKE